MRLSPTGSKRASTNCASRARSITRAVLAERYNSLAGYVAMDDRLWDLENRVELHAGPGWTTEADDETVLRFGAFIAAYNGDAHDASLAWEKLGETELAIAQAREAGEMERAYNLLRRAGLAIPEELSTAVKLARQAAQMAAKQQGLRRAERRAGRPTGGLAEQARCRRHCRSERRSGRRSFPR